MSDRLTHQDEDGRVRMVDVAAKPVTGRRAVAGAHIGMSADAFAAVRDGQGPKGNALYAAELAGIMAAKKTAELIPLCHPLPLTSVKVLIEPDGRKTGFDIRAEVLCDGKTGVEMEALTAASVAALTLYDMAKALDKSMTISAVCLLEKSGGRSGDYQRAAE
ncbi:cyclic pyranopterin monophosphate synthase MoaC [Hyphobacterium sp. HN65]|uniref:Cyclic pyranopterin monophosphate synthase n=1 Tax=Hyphobacterium lacteum TaxID=3116575 RepID=A0ABU7LTZ2_9PROT|nr:cyclic pyranopterin monophosphate synthase MoaC [Hyphobacterium sp. HN65]MEE2527368.1 cyclic pyranopterin monophosphate synthase MoaC [Hyphobacterium sp. HN65]